MFGPKDMTWTEMNQRRLDEGRAWREILRRAAELTPEQVAEYRRKWGLSPLENDKAA